MLRGRSCKKSQITNHKNHTFLFYSFPAPPLAISWRTPSARGRRANFRGNLFRARQRKKLGASRRTHPLHSTFSAGWMKIVVPSPEKVLCVVGKSSIFASTKTKERPCCKTHYYGNHIPHTLSLRPLWAARHAQSRRHPLRRPGRRRETRFSSLSPLLLHLCYFLHCVWQPVSAISRNFAA